MVSSGSWAYGFPFSPLARRLVSDFFFFFFFFSFFCQQGSGAGCQRPPPRMWGSARLDGSNLAATSTDIRTSTCSSSVSKLSAGKLISSAKPDMAASAHRGGRAPDTRHLSCELLLPSQFPLVYRLPVAERYSRSVSWLAHCPVARSQMA